tara:strand:- start:1342 stop:1563 length:222 start_codon:yes stop_codon:yes gene_type:complete
VLCNAIQRCWLGHEHDHLINLLYGKCTCIVFDGTVELDSGDEQNAVFVAEVMRQCIERIGVWPSFKQTPTHAQ